MPSALKGKGEADEPTAMVLTLGLRLFSGSSWPWFWGGAGGRATYRGGRDGATFLLDAIHSCRVSLQNGRGA